MAAPAYLSALLALARHPVDKPRRRALKLFAEKVAAISDQHDDGDGEALRNDLEAAAAAQLCEALPALLGASGEPFCPYTGATADVMSFELRTKGSNLLPQQTATARWRASHHQRRPVSWGWWPSVRPRSASRQPPRGLCSPPSPPSLPRCATRSAPCEAARWRPPPRPWRRSAPARSPCCRASRRPCLRPPLLRWPGCPPPRQQPRRSARQGTFSHARHGLTVLSPA